jgi:hypothetical protein
VEHGLWAAQQRFFSAWFFPVYGVIWLPAAQCVLWALFLNLLAAFALRLPLSRRRAGLLAAHLGVLILLAGGWVTERFGHDSFLTLMEGESANASVAYRTWELALWPLPEGAERDVTAVDAGPLAERGRLTLARWDLELAVETYHRHCAAFTSPSQTGGIDFLNASSIAFLRAEKPNADPQADVPGMVLRIGPRGQAKKVLLFGGAPAPTSVPIDGLDLAVSLRRKRYPLPFALRLVDFRRTYHPNSSIPRSFESLVEVDPQGMNRRVRIEMNRPLRHLSYAFYQASFAERDGGVEASTFAVTRNAGRHFPYVATALTVAGLMVHFVQVLSRKQRTAGENA